MKRKSTGAQAGEDALEEATETTGGPEFSSFPTGDLGGEQSLVDRERLAWQASAESAGGREREQ